MEKHKNIHPDFDQEVNKFSKIIRFKVVLKGYGRCPDSHDLSECHHLYDLGRHM